MTDDGFCAVFVLINELFGAGEGDLVDEAVHFVSCHAYSVVGNGECLFLLVDGDTHTGVAQVALDFTDGRQSLQFLRCINGITD